MKNLLIKYKLNTAEVVYAVLFAMMTVLSRHTTYSDKAESNILTVRITSLQVIDLLILIAAFVVMYVVLQLIKQAVFKLRPYIFVEGERYKLNKVLGWLIVFAVIMICYIPYLMSYWPGGIYNDTIDSIDIALGKSAWTNQNTVLYALFWRLIFFIGLIFDQGNYGGLKLMTVLQCAAVAGTAASFVTWLRGRGVRRWVRVLLTVIVAVMPIFPYYGISLWKETWFGLALFCYTWMWYALRGEIKGAKNTSVYVMSTTWIIFGRNNGLYVVLFVMIVSIIVMYRRLKQLKADKTDASSNDSVVYIELKNGLKRFTIVNITIILVSLFIQGPVYKIAGIRSSSPAESLGIPLQQTAYMISMGAMDNAVDGTLIEDIDSAVKGSLSMSDKEYDTITSIMPLTGWINLYNPVVVDSIKFGDFFDREYFNSHPGEFLKAYAGLAIKNPGQAIKGHLLSTIGFWDAYKSSSSAYICTVHTVQAEYFMSDYFNLKTDKYLSDIVGPRWYISGGALVWIMLGLFMISIAIKKSDMSVCVFLPGIGLWLTYLLATPLSFSFRYLFGLLLCMPLYLGTLYMKENG